MDPAATEALIAETTNKAGLVWVRASGPHHTSQPMWHVWHEGAVYVLTGGSEQPVPEGLADRVFVTVPGKNNGPRLVTFEASVEVVDAASETWAAVEPQLLSGRLNLPDAETAAQRWARECTLYRLVPTGEVAETPDEPTRASHAAPPPPTPATSQVTRPLHVRGRPSRNRGGM
jgi:hypothetical protein